MRQVLQTPVLYFDNILFLYCLAPEAPLFRAMLMEPEAFFCLPCMSGLWLCAWTHLKQGFVLHLFCQWDIQQILTSYFFRRDLRNLREFKVLEALHRSRIKNLLAFIIKVQFYSLRWSAAALKKINVLITVSIIFVCTVIMEDPRWSAAVQVSVSCKAPVTTISLPLSRCAMVLF